MDVLVVGGAGYIGSHAVTQLIDKGYEVTVVDNLLTGHREAVHPEANFVLADIRDKEVLSQVFEARNFVCVFHFAASSLVGESVEQPLKYFDNNVTGMISLLEVMVDHGVNKIIFSSTAAVYGDVDIPMINEDLPTNPVNPYGLSKRMMEQIMEWCQEAYGMNYISLRYFNVAGALEGGNIGEDHHPETHLIPIILQVANNQREYVTIFGDDYRTPDGTCIRDYIHVVDLIDAHIKAYEYLNDGGQSQVFNLGSSQGFSVKEIVEACRQVTDCCIPAQIGERREGDPAKLVASSDKAREILGWQPQYDDIKKIIASAWAWHQTRPEGYGEE